MKSFFDYLDHRLGYRKLIHEALFENVPGGSRWRYVWGSTLTFALVVQFITGVFLWMAYSPSAQTAWESVYFIQYQMFGGWLLRGIHHYMAHVMIVLLVLHIMQVIIDGAYKAPREWNFWFGIVLLILVMALALTGYLLPWDQKGFWASNVAMNLVGIVPVIGPGLQKIIIGGTEYGHHTLTRFFAFHAGFLPATVVILTVGHIYLFRRHGLTPKKPLRSRDTAFWPDQVLKDAVACLAVMAAVLFLVIRPRLFDAEAPLGAELGAPADLTEPYSAARPEWYFLFLFQMLKYFHGEYAEIIGAIVIPGATIGILFLMPLIGKWKVGHYFNVGFMFALLIGVLLLTYLAKHQDNSDPLYAEAVREAYANSERVKQLAGSPSGIPPEGAVELLRNDPLTQGPQIFAKHCSSCHLYDGHDGRGTIPEDPQSAPDLKGFASREWISRLMDPVHFSSPEYFGNTAFADGRMAKWLVKRYGIFTDELKAAIKHEVAIAISAEAELKSQEAMDVRDAALISKGREMIVDEFGCIDCHEFDLPDEEATAPKLMGYGSREWLIGIISNPSHPDFYGDKNDRMPAYLNDEIMTRRQIELVADWLREDWYTLETADNEAELNP